MLLHLFVFILLSLLLCSVACGFSLSLCDFNYFCKGHLLLLVEACPLACFITCIGVTNVMDINFNRVKSVHMSITKFSKMKLNANCNWYLVK